MKNKRYINKGVMLLFGLGIILSSCERDFSDDVEFATLPSGGDVFLDAPIGLGSDFYFPYGPDANNPLGSKPTAWSVDEEVSYKGSASMRIDVPNSDDPEGNFAGAILRIDGAGRNLSGYDALTFWAKASQGAVITEIGFGEDFGENKYITTLTDLSLSTQWTKYTIPIPDPSKLINERGMFRYSAGANIIGLGFSFWIDELKFEKLGTVAQPRPAIVGGEDVVQTSFIGVNAQIGGLTQTFNTESGQNVTVSAAPSYYSFTSTDPDVARINELGQITILDSGTAEITAILGGVKAAGSLTIESLGDFVSAPNPTRDAANVISIFSDAYENVPVDYYNGFFTPDGQTTLGGEPPLDVGSGKIISYTDLNFVGIGFFLNVSSINATEMTHIHVDINVQEIIQSGDFIRLLLLNSVGNGETSGSVTITADQLNTNEWISLDIPLSDFAGLVDRDKLGLLFFISDSTISDIYVDNIYFYKE